MDKKTEKKRSKSDRSNLESGFEMDPNKGKKKKHKDRKKKHATEKMLNSNETLEENFTGEAADKQTCSIEGNITSIRNGEEERHIDKRKRKRGRKDNEVMDSNVADGKEVQFLDENQQIKMKKRKNYDDSLTGKQEMGFSKPSKKGKMTKDNELINNEGDPPLDRISAGNSNAHSLVADVDCEDEKTQKKKKLSNKSKRTVRDYKSNEGDHSVVTEGRQGKKMKMKKILSKKNERTEDEEYETNGGDLCLAKNNAVDPPVSKSNGDQHLVKSNEGEDDDRGKKKKKKLSVESKHKEYNEFKSNEGEDDDQGKKKKKLNEGSKHKKYNEFKSNEGEDDDLGKKKKKKKKLSEGSKHKEYSEFRSDEGEDGDQGKKMKKKLSNKGKSKENSEFNRNEDDPPLARVKSGDDNACSVVTEVNDQGKEMNKEKTAKVGTGESHNPARDGTSKPKRVTFSDQVDVCCDGLVHGKRYTREEDEKIKVAVFDYIESHGLGDEGLDMVLHCKKHPEVRDCWKEIGAALPDRPHLSVYYRAHILFERGESRKWTRDELEFVRKVQEQHGSDWKSVAEALDKSRFHVKDAWRRIKLTNIKRGRWTQEEIQNLFDLVNLDLRSRASEGFRKSKHGMLRDNISWEAIGSKLSTRTSQVCCKKWYEKLASPMVSKGEWSDTDDYRLVNALYALDACCMEEVDWDNLLEHRSGDVCRKRWNQMVQQIGEHGGKPFAEQVEILSKRYSPDLLEAREDFDNKPVVC